MSIRFHVNVDHVATLRQARGTAYPDPVHAAVMVEQAGADGITVHLREDRRHIQDRDVEVMRRTVTTHLNLEMAATSAMVEFALAIRPDQVTLVPEKREERTTEGGLDLLARPADLAKALVPLFEAKIPISLFIDPDPAQILAARDLGAAGIELHTGDYANALGHEAERQLGRLRDAAACASREAPQLAVAAGHGLTLRNLPALLRRVPEVGEVNIGHAVIADSVFAGLAETVHRYRRVLAAAVGERR